MSHIMIVARPGQEISRLLAELQRHSLECVLADPGAAPGLLEKRPADLLIVDLSEPGADRLCLRVQEQTRTPVLALAAPTQALGLNGQVDDFVMWPGTGLEVVIRARRLMHRKAAHTPERICSAGIEIDCSSFEVVVNGRSVSLTFREYELLKFLAANPGRVFTRDTLLNRVWGHDFFGGDRTVDVHIRRLRSKIEDPAHIYVETVRNIGYRFIKSRE